jgi:hypothetical protein
MLALDRIRRGGKQTVTVVHQNVAVGPRRGGYFTRRRPSSVRVTECRPPEMMSQSRLIEFAHDANRRLLDRANFSRASSASSALR